MSAAEKTSENHESGGGILVLLVAVVVVFAISYKVSPLSWGCWGSINESSGLALHGYDPVSYHTAAGPMQGEQSQSVDWSAVEWRFASAENMGLFQETPDKYAPLYGGFCATAVSAGFTADIDPEAWHIHEGRLYVFADTSPRDDWIAQVYEGIVERGDANWAAAPNQPAAQN